MRMDTVHRGAKEIDLDEIEIEGGHCLLQFGVGTDCKNNCEDKHAATVVRFRDAAGFMMRANSDGLNGGNGDNEITLTFAGTAELHCLIEAFEFAAASLRAQAGIKPGHSNPYLRSPRD